MIDTTPDPPPEPDRPSPPSGAGPEPAPEEPAQAAPEQEEPAGAAEGQDGPAHRTRRAGTGPLRFLAILVIIGGLILSAAGVVTWIVVTDQLSDEKIVVSEDADNLAGEDVDGPFTAYAEADVINEHALEASDGQTYAQLDQDDPGARP
jgi:hypothetical protein